MRLDSPYRQSLSISPAELTYLTFDQKEWSQKRGGVAQIIGIDHILLIWLMRHVVVIGTLGEVGIDNYLATNIIRNLSTPQLAAGVNHLCNTCGPVKMALPAFLDKMGGNRKPTDPKNCPFQNAFRMTDSLSEWFPEGPESLVYSHLFMSGQRGGRANRLDFFPLEEQLACGITDGDDAVMVVDVGGALGHDVGAIKAKHLKLPGGMMLQDLLDSIK